MDLEENKKVAMAAMAEPDFSQMPVNAPMQTPATQPGDFAAMPNSPPGEPDFSQMPEHPPGMQPPAPPMQDPNSPMPGAGIAQQNYANGGVQAVGMAPNAQNLSDLGSFQNAQGTNDLNQAAAQQQNAEDLKAQAQSATAQASQGAYHQQTQDAIARQQDLQMRAKATQDRSEEILRKQADIVDQQAKMLSVHPDGIWQKSGVNPIAGSVALLLGAAGSGTRNTAMDAINHRIDMNIADQKRQFEQLGQVAAGYNNTYANLHQQLGDDISVTNAMKLLSADSVKAMLDEAANKTANMTIKAQAAKAKADIDSKLVQDQNAYRKTVFDQQAKAVDAHLGFSKVGVDLDKNRIDEANNNLQHQDRVSGQLVDLEKGQNEARAKLGMGFKGVPGSERLDPGVKKEIGERITGGEKVGLAVKGIMANGKKGIVMRTLDNPQYLAQLQNALRQSKGLSNRVSGAEGALLERMAGYAAHGTLAKFLPTIDEDAFYKAMEKLEEDSNADVRAELHTYGLEPNQDSYLYKDPAKKDLKSFAESTLSKLSAQ